MKPDELPPDVHTIELWVDGRFARRMSREVFEEERAVAEVVMPLLREGLKYFEQVDTPPPALRGTSSSVPPNRTPIEDEREARELVPLVRAAADEVPVGDVPHLPIDETKLSGFAARWNVHVHEQVAAELNHLIGQMLAAAPAAIPRCEPDVKAEIREAMERAEAMPPPGPAMLFMTRRQIERLRERETATPYIRRPYDGIIAELAGVRVVALPERTRWQRFRAWLRRWRWLR